MNHILHVLHTLHALEPQCEDCHGTGYRERDTGPVICGMCPTGDALRDHSMRESVPTAPLCLAHNCGKPATKDGWCDSCYNADHHWS